MSGLKDRVAIVTGGGRGIGKAISKRLAADGAKVVVCYAGNEQSAADTLKEIEAAGGTGSISKLDVSNAEEALEAIGKIAEAQGRLDILVNNAGISKDNLILRTKVDEWDSVLDTNLRGAWACSKAAVRLMLKAKSNTGRIVNITSVVGETGNAGQTTYAAAKAGMIGLTRALALEVASRNVTVNAVAPGYISTDMTAALPDTVKKQLEERIPLGRIGAPEDVAGAVAFLCSDSASYVTGQVIRVNGGMHMA